MGSCDTAFVGVLLLEGLVAGEDSRDRKSIEVIGDLAGDLVRGPGEGDRVLPYDLFSLNSIDLDF